MNVPRFALVTASVAACAVLAYLVHPSALFPAPVPNATARPAVFAESLGRARVVVARTLVYVAGDVVHPGVYAVRADARAADALALAGGAKGDADLVAVNLAAHVADGDEIAVPRIGEAGRAHARSGRAHGPHARGRHRRSAPRATTQPVADALLDLNAADADALASLPGLGPALAERIVAFRAANGRFDSVDELADVSGVTPSRLDKIIPFLIVNAAPR